MDKLTQRAFAAYFRHPPAGAILDQPDSASGPVDWQGKTYVVLFNINGVLAVYRVRTSGALKRLVRWPKGIEPATPPTPAGATISPPRGGDSPYNAPRHVIRRRKS
jgi:hypothetical protein